LANTASYQGKLPVDNKACGYNDLRMASSDENRPVT